MQIFVIILFFIVVEIFANVFMKFFFLSRRDGI